MSLNTQQKSLIELMNRQYGQIRETEAIYGIFGMEGDFRPRIEYYHDAVRAFSSGSASEYSKGSRLSVERLAYDVAMLRNIQSKPLHAGRGEQHLLPHGGLMVMGKDGKFPEPDREARGQLQQLYKDYTVLFVALLSEKADRNAENRTEEMNTTISDLAMLQEMLSQLANGKADAKAVSAVIDQLENDDLRHAMKSLITQGKLSRAEIAAAQNKIKTTSGAIEQEVDAVDKAAHNFATGKLAVYEDAKDTVNRLAASGMNVAGKFVEGAIAQSAAKQRGR